MAETGLAGSWNLVKEKNDNYDKFLDAVGMNKIKRGMVTKLGGSIVIKFQDNGKMYVKTTNGPKTKEREMAIGSEFEDEGPNGGPFKGTWKVEGNKMVGHFQNKKDSNKNLTMTREVINGELVQAMDFGGVSCKRYYKK